MPHSRPDVLDEPVGRVDVGRPVEGAVGVERGDVCSAEAREGIAGAELGDAVPLGVLAEQDTVRAVPLTQREG